jgi:hypothetical protein
MEKHKNALKTIVKYIENEHLGDTRNLMETDPKKALIDLEDIAQEALDSEPTTAGILYVMIDYLEHRLERIITHISSEGFFYGVMMFALFIVLFNVIRTCSTG